MARIRSVAIPTCHRVESLERALLSYILLAKTFGRELEFVVADDSPSVDYREHTRGMLRSIARYHDVRIFYAGLEEKRLFVEALAHAADASRSVVEFGLLGGNLRLSGAGANRNVVLLDCLDQLFYSADDDTVARAFFPHGREKDALEIHGPAQRVWDGHGEPADFIWRFFPSLGAAVSAAESEPVDILDVHERLLGERVADVEGRFPGRVVRRGSGTFGPQGVMGQTGRVRFTMTGVLGDVGVDERWHLVTNTPEVLAQLGSESTYRTSLDSRTILRCARRTTLTRWVGLHGMFFGADQRGILPPFFPVLRGQDTLLGWMVRRCYPHDQFGFLPYALMHVPPPRKFERGFEFLDCGLSMADILRQIISEKPAGASAEAALAEMSRELRAAGSCSLSSFAEPLRTQWQATTPYLAQFISSLGPDMAHLGAGLERVLETRQRVRNQHDGSVPFDLLDGRTHDDARALAQDLTRRFGELVDAWPAIVDATRQLRRQGIRPARAMA